MVGYLPSKSPKKGREEAGKKSSTANNEAMSPCTEAPTVGRVNPITLPLLHAGLVTGCQQELVGYPKYSPSGSPPLCGGTS